MDTTPTDADTHGDAARTPRRRAPAMSLEQRRAMIVAAALPLVTELGAAVTTGQIARAAGIGEGTIFRAFPDKDAVLDACLAEAARSDHALSELAGIDLAAPLAERLTAAIEAVRAHLARMGAVAGSLLASGHRVDRRPAPRPGAREEAVATLRAAVAELLEPDRDALRFPAEQVAGLLLGLLFTMPAAGPGRDHAMSPGEVVDALLRGVLGERDPAPEPPAG
jgi:AcrR family transcriptional regulator